MTNECENPEECVGPYGPEGGACGYPCSLEHDEKPRPETCLCMFCASRRAGEDPFTFDPSVLQSIGGADA